MYDKSKTRLVRLMKIIKGFTLVELLVVIAIIGILASLAITSFRVILVRAQDSRNKALADSVGTAVTQYGVDHGDKFPIAAGGQINVSDLEGDLLNYLKTNAALTQATGVAKYTSNCDGSSFAAAWELQYTNDPVVSSGNGVYSTNASGVGGTVSVPNTYGCALNFNGTDQFGTIPNNAAFSFAGNFTISFWVKKQTALDIWPRVILEKRSGSGPSAFPFSFIYTPSCTTGILSVTVDRSNGTGGLGTKTWCGDTRIDVTNNGTSWHNVVLIKNGTTISLHIDGVSNASHADVVGVGTTNNAIDINLASRNGVSDFFEGAVDDLRIYSTNLTIGPGSDVANLYNVGKGNYTNAAALNLLAIWRMNEGSGATFANSGSLSGVNGTLTNVSGSTWIPGVAPLGLEGIGSSLLKKAFVIYGPQ